MKLLPWYRRKVHVDEGEGATYLHTCSSANRDRWQSLVGGTIYVTTRQLIFIPNVLAALLGRQPWTEQLDDIVRTRAETVHLSPLSGELPVLRILVARADVSATRTRTIVMTRGEEVGDLETSIGHTGANS